MIAGALASLQSTFAFAPRLHRLGMQQWRARAERMPPDLAGRPASPPMI